MQERRPAAAVGAGRGPLLVLVATTVVVGDQATKTWALRRLVDGDIDLVGSLRLHLTYNTGGAFSIGSGNAWFFVVAAVVLVAVVLRLGRSATAAAPTIAIGLVVGGAIGNLVDRLFRDLGGAVVDFVDLQWFPVFNVADAAITLGAIALALSTARAPDG